MNVDDALQCETCFWANQYDSWLYCCLSGMEASVEMADCNGKCEDYLNKELKEAN